MKAFYYVVLIFISLWLLCLILHLLDNDSAPDRENPPPLPAHLQR
jgi:hypothetical protein